MIIDYLIIAVLFLLGIALSRFAKRNLMSVFLAVIVILIIPAFGYNQVHITMFLISVLAAYGLAFFYTKISMLSYIFLAVLAAEYVATAFLGLYAYPIMLGFGLGAAAVLLDYSDERKSVKSAYANRKKVIEINRDMFQLALAAIILVVLGVFGRLYGLYILFGLELLGVFGLLTAWNSKYHLGFFRSLKKEEQVYEHGALFLAAGLSILLGLLHQFNFEVFGAILLLVCDPLATIFGLKLGKIKLAYNKEKSLFGSLAFFVAGAIAGFLLVGYIGIAIAAIIAVVEGLRSGIDDNILIAVSYGILALLVV
ncbi:hypothetical protein M1373_01980 [Candidatus Marsarchaeota archaeon]|nr:hypothetical protein [Candidatus Marsarchaeota archaeon]MCL5404361.1 hypothetical protein [Candidatus Marsarchaeota archaeon]